MIHQRPERIELTRSALYEKVWTIPMMHLAQEFGLSGPGLAKICLRYEIPRPSRGYWAKKRHGISVRQTSLPRTTDPRLDKIVIYKGVKVVDESLSTEAHAAIANEKQLENQIVVSTSHENPLAIIERTSKSLLSATPDERSLVGPRAKKALDVKVRKVNVNRSMLIMDALLKALKDRGYSFTAEDKNRGRVMKAVVLGEEIEFQLLDVVRQRERELTSEEKRMQQEDRWFYFRDRYVFVPLDRLELRITTYLGDGIRRTWGDGKTRKLEDLLNAFIVGLVRASEAQKERRKQREIREREWEEEQQRAAVKQRLIEEENTRIKALNEALSVWHTSQMIREYIQAVKKAEIERSGTIDPGSDFEKWITWASDHANKLDPRHTLPRYQFI